MCAPGDLLAGALLHRQRDIHFALAAAASEIFDASLAAVGLYVHAAARPPLQAHERIALLLRTSFLACTTLTILESSVSSDPESPNHCERLPSVGVGVELSLDASASASNPLHESLPALGQELESRSHSLPVS